MTVANQFANAVAYASYDRNGKLEQTNKNWFRFECKRIERHIIHGDDRGALDPSEVWVFKDGSMVHIDNPRQVCFPVRLSACTMADINPETWDWK